MVTKTGKHKLQKNEITNSLRWEDDGGKIIETNDSTPERHFVRPAPIYGGMPGKFLHWNERFSIEPLQPDTGIGLTKGNAPGKT